MGKKVYQIKVKEILDDSWADWFVDMNLSIIQDTEGNSISVLTGPVADQAELNGILTKIWNLNLTVLSVEQL